jgi:hypothetical protein
MSEEEKQKVLKILRYAQKVYDEFSLRTLSDRVFGDATGRNIDQVRIIIESLILKGEFNARIRGDVIVFNKGEPVQELSEELITNTTEFLKKASVVFQELSFTKIKEKTGMDVENVEQLLEKLIMKGQIYAKIKRDGIVYIDRKDMEGIDKLLGAYKDWEDKQHNKKD